RARVPARRPGAPPPHGPPPRSPQRRRVVGPPREDGLEARARLGRAAGAQPRVGEAGLGGHEPGPLLQDAPEALLGVRQVSAQERAPGFLEFLGLGGPPLAGTRGREEGVVGVPEGLGRGLGAGRRDEGREQEEPGAPLQARCSRYRSRKRSGISTSSLTSWPTTSWDRTRPAPYTPAMPRASSARKRSRTLRGARSSRA